MGLLDSFDDPNTVGLLSLGAGLLNASGPSRMPVSLGQALGRGMQAGIAGYQQAKELADQDAYKGLQMDAMRQKTTADAQRFQREQQLQGLVANRLGLGGTPAGAPVASASIPGLSGTSSSSPPAFSAAALQPAPSGNPFPFSLNDITALTALDAPGSKGLFDLFKYANDGIKREAGNYYTSPSNGQTTYFPRIPEGATMTQDGRIVGVPGAAQTNATYKGAETAAIEGAKAGLDFVTIPMPNGSTRTVRRDQAAGMFGGGNLGTFGVSQSPADRTYQDEAAKAVAEQYKQIQNAGFTAPSKIAKYQQLGQLLANHDGGRLSGAGLELAQLGNSLGIKIDKNLPNKEAAQALVNELALSLRNPAGGEGMPGAMSDSDRQFLVNSVPGLSQSAEGRRQMVQMQTQVLQRQADVAKMARQWQQRHGRLDATNPNTGRSFFDNLQDWSDRNRLFAQPQQ